MIAGKFLIERLLGAGSMGAVYQAQQLALERAVAIKVMHGTVASDATYAARFHLEDPKAASRLDHPNVIRILDYGQGTGWPQLYIAMEFLDARSLDAVFTEDWPLSHERLVDVLSPGAGRARGGARIGRLAPGSEAREHLAPPAERQRMERRRTS